MECHVTTEIQTHTITNAFLYVIKQVTPPHAVITFELTND